MHLITISNKDMKLELKRRHKTDIGLSFIEEEEEKLKSCIIIQEASIVDYSLQ